MFLIVPDKKLNQGSVNEPKVRSNSTEMDAGCQKKYKPDLEMSCIKYNQNYLLKLLRIFFNML